MGELDIGLLYLGLHNGLVKKYGENYLISRKELFCKLGKHGQIPHNLKHQVMNEMIEKKLLERVNRDVLKILPLIIDIYNDSNKLFNFLEKEENAEKSAL